MLASVTRLRVRSLRFLPAFLWHTFKSQRQVTRAAGFCGGRLLVDSHWTFWTLTVWENEQAMRKFRGSGAHARVMSHLPRWCDEAAYAHWMPATDAIPEWLEAYEKLVAEIHWSRVEYPSEDHSKKRFQKPRLSPLIGADLKPVKTRSN
ncbi:MAG: DUF3291 domain-containing protein [Candidatus Sulfotelmatobacter sp.]